MKKVVLTLAVALVAVFGFAFWQYPHLLLPGRKAEMAQVQPPTPQAEPAAPPAAGPASSEQVAERPVEEVNESADAETPLASILPRRSLGHAAGLHKTDDALDLSSSAAVVMDAQSRSVVYAKNPEAVLPVASITKLMTAMVLLDAKLAMDETITITEDDMDKQRNSRSRLRVGSVLTRGEALRLALMSSENRAAHALARTHPAGLEAFVKAMNHKARQVGMTNTAFRDPTGLATENMSTANDLAMLVIAASAYPLIREESTKQQHEIAVGNRVLRYRNSNPLVRNSAWDIALQKTGYIVEAGHCVVMRTKMAGKDLVMVLLDASSNGRRTADAGRVQQWIAPAEAAAAREAARVAVVKPAKKTKQAKGGKQAQAKTKVAAAKDKKASTAAAKKKTAPATAKRKTAPDERTAEQSKAREKKT